MTWAESSNSSLFLGSATSYSLLFDLSEVSYLLVGEEADGCSSTERAEVVRGRTAMILRPPAPFRVPREKLSIEIELIECRDPIAVMTMKRGMRLRTKAPQDGSGRRNPRGRCSNR